ncbi:FadR/GntR family transcriptional regulator [Meinhardsimonia xiamenensis]|uniref:FadR/GntR family transcriptional regulator n=1 Tax=Meinhardsimonia xiamenensis TaxID=990712 RepID=UPI00201293A3|nr:FadR/GntR family transcriptional regulator [Meinhardsimonia xiamenensis]
MIDQFGGDVLTRPADAERELAIERLQAFIVDGGYGPGDRLPPERDLMVELGMSRTTLRKALEKLENDGAIWRHVGKGTFVAAKSVPRQPGWLAEISQQLTPVKMMRARLCLEPAIAREAAMNASAEAVAAIRRAEREAVEAADWAGYEAADDRFHRAVARAADNILLAALYDQLNQVQRAVAWRSVVRETERPPRDHPSFAEHARIASAIEARDPGEAQAAMRAHIGSVSARLFGEV